MSYREEEDDYLEIDVSGVEVGLALNELDEIRKKDIEKLFETMKNNIEDWWD